jgi:hypothetical protein
VEQEAARRFRLRSVDDISHAGQRLVFRCEQIVQTGHTGRITGIGHVDLPGQLEVLPKFKALFESGTSGDREC